MRESQQVTGQERRGRRRVYISGGAALAAGLLITAFIANTPDKPAAEEERPVVIPRHPAVESVCTADGIGNWEAVPSDISVEAVAVVLGVNMNSIAQGGRMGPATCDKPFGLEQIGASNPPIVSVTDIGSPCLVADTQTVLQPGTYTAEVVAICPQNGS